VSESSTTIGKIEYIPNKVLGHGSLGTTVYEGRFRDRNVAVKRLLGHYTGFADVEISNLLKADAHPNIVRYFDMEEDEDFLYIAIEECAGSLDDLIKMASGEGGNVD
jgi:serine/threonine-protein kinase/endoribonuclease IRE1